MDNQAIATIFGEIADMMDIKGEDFFRVNAYRRAAQTIGHMSQDLRDLYAQDPDSLENIPGIGKALAEKIVEMLTTGKCRFYTELVHSFPKGLLAMLRVRGVGPKKVKLFFGELKIHTLAQLKKAATMGKLRELPGMGEKSERDILSAIADFEAMPHERRLIHEATAEAHEYIAYMKRCKAVATITYAGSLRRGVETIGDVDLLVCGRDHVTIMDHFVAYKEVRSVLGRGETKCSVLLSSGMQVDLRVLDKRVFGAGLHYFTGSKAHNIKIRDRAKRMGLKVSEYGVFRVTRGRDTRGSARGQRETFIGGATEEELFHLLKLPYIPPELREDRGEIAYADQHKTMPTLVTLADVRGDLHTHSRWSDGSEEIEDIARAYKKAGFSYMALTDHSKAIGITRGMNDERVAEQWDEIDELNDDLAPFRILKGSEVDILKDGRLDYSEKTLKRLEVVNASAHLHHNLPEREQTKRLIAAVSSGYVKVLSHPTGRLIQQRKPISFDYEAVFKACVDHHVALEINASPSRLDLNDQLILLARELGAKFTISSDAHHSSQREFLQYGVLMARRGWLTSKDILNTMTLKQLLAYWKLH